MDSDGDGYSDVDEAGAGTNPNDASSYPGSTGPSVPDYTDSDGDDKKNLDLSKRRAAAVKDRLIKDFKIEASRLSSDGKGEADPVAPNTTAEGKALNRRVEFVKI